MFVAVTGLLSKIDSNHASVASHVVQTSRLGPVARYSGIFAVSTVLRKRSVEAGRVEVDATFGDASPTSAVCKRVEAIIPTPSLPCITLPSGSRIFPLHMSTILEVEGDIKYCDAEGDDAPTEVCANLRDFPCDQLHSGCTTLKFYDDTKFTIIKDGTVEIMIHD